MLNATAISVGNQGICDDTSMTKIAAESIASQTTLADIGTSVMCGRMNQARTRAAARARASDARSSIVDRAVIVAVSDGSVVGARGGAWLYTQE